MRSWLNIMSRTKGIVRRGVGLINDIPLCIDKPKVEEMCNFNLRVYRYDLFEARRLGIDVPALFRQTIRKALVKISKEKHKTDAERLEFLLNSLREHTREIQLLCDLVLAPRLDSQSREPLSHLDTT